MVNLSEPQHVMVMILLLTLGWICASLRICAAAGMGTGTQIIPVVVLEPNKIILKCFGNEIEKIQPLNRSVTVAAAEFMYCTTPRESYAAVLKALTINVTGLSELSLAFHKSFELSATHFNGLSIQKLELKNGYSHLLWVDREVLMKIVTLTDIKLNNVRLSSLSTQLKSITLEDSVGTGRWGDCAELQRLELGWYDVIKYKNVSFLSHCSQLRKLILHNLKPEMVQYALNDLRTLTSLSVHKCNITSLSYELLRDAIELRYLNLSNNNFKEIQTSAFKSLLRLQVLDLSYNHLQNIEFQEKIEPLKDLRNLSLEGNIAFDICGHWSETPPPPLLERLSLRRTGLEWLCLRNLKSLTFVDLSETKIIRLEINVLMRFPTILVDLRGNNINTIIPNHRTAETMSLYEGVKNVTVLLDCSMDCDCSSELPRLLRTMPRLVLSGLLCSGSERLDFSTVPLERVECDKYPCSNCTCRRSWLDQAIEVDCLDLKLRKVPHLRKGKTLLASDNLIDRLHPDDIPKSFMLVDLRDNRLSYVDANATAALFAVNDRRVRLSGNPLVCDCVNERLLSALRTHRSQVEDYDNITCAGDERTLSDVVLEELCSEPESRQKWLLIAMFASTIAVISLTATLCYHYERQIKVFLFAHGCCLFCLHEEDIDADREYDAFVSFCHEDEEFVNDHFLPELKNYKLCIHYRDWVVGDWISAQIAKSIEKSRRTIIVLSRNFLASLWGMHEFRMAHSSTLQEGRPRLIVVLLDDLLDDPRLDAELRGYLATNTYVRWGERCFWNKIRFALPHRQSQDQAEDATAPQMELYDREMPP